MFNKIEQFYNQQNFIVIFLLRVLFVVILAVLLFIIGLMIGYSVLGDGGNPFSIFSREVWQKIIDFVQ